STPSVVTAWHERRSANSCRKPDLNRICFRTNPAIARGNSRLMESRLSSLKVEDLRTTNAAMTRCISLAKLAAKSDVPIVLLGETGTGKTPLAQVKILRVLEYGEFERLGSERMLKTDARIICATNVSLRDRVRQGKFREDLYHRLNGLTILIPALRDRREELPGLIANELKV